MLRPTCAVGGRGRGQAKEADDHDEVALDGEDVSEDAHDDTETVTRTDDQADGRTVVRADSRSHTRAYFGSYGILGADGRADAVPERHVLEFRGTVRGVQRPSRGVQGLRVRRLHR